MTARQDLRRGHGLAALFWIASLRTRLRAARHAVGTDLTSIAALIDGKTLEVVVDRVLPFKAIKEGMAYLESGHAKSNVVVTMT
jgi:alcohol dehydrogenase